MLFHDRSRFILSAINRDGGFIILENPGSRMTWLDDQMVSCVHAEALFAFFRPTPYGFREVVQHLSKHVAFGIN